MSTVALLALGLVVLEAVADVLPDDALVGVFTPVRIVVLVGLVALACSIRRFDRSTLAWRLPFDVAAALLLVGAAYAAHAFGAWADWRGLATCVAVAYLAAGVMRATPEAWHGIGMLSLVAVGTAGLTGVRQSVNGIPTGFCRGAIDGSADACGHADVLVRANGTFGNPNLLAAFLILFLPLAVAGAVALGSRHARALGWLVCVAGVAGLVATGSRAGMLALLAACGAFLVLRRPTMPRIVVGAAAATVVAAAGVFVSAFGVGTGVRGDVWSATVRLVEQHPWGVGIGRTGSVIDAAVPGDEAFTHAHNWWLDTLLAAGPAGLLGAIGLSLLAAVSVVRAARRGSASALALGSSLAGFGVLCLVDDPLNAIRTAYAAWLVLGLAASAGHGVRHREPERHGPPDAENGRPGDTVPASSAAAGSRAVVPDTRAARRVRRRRSTIPA